jgi:GTP pyrophosphokinase
VKHAELDIGRQSARAQQAAQFLRDAAPPESVDLGLELAGVLSQLQADDDLLLAGLLVPSVGFLTAQEARLAEVFGDPTVRLVRELERVADSGIPAGWNPGAHLKPAQAEGLRKLLLSLASDVRLVLLRLAVQLVRLRHQKDAPDAERQRAALETREIYAPLASRLGIWHVKWELEDLAFRYNQPEDYKRIAGWLRSKRDERERYIEEVRGELARELEKVGVVAGITGRPKHIYSIWRKMQRKGLAFEQVMDVLAVRVQVETVGECYAALGVVHGLWPYIPGEFDDYIATPK